MSAEPYLIEIGDDVTISHGVDFITHDNSVCKIFGVDHDLYGKIVIGNECFIGAHAVLMYGVTLPNRVIVAAGSVVTKSPETGNVILGGNPARVIGSLDQFGEKTKMKEIHAGHLSYAEKRQKVLDSVDRWVVR